MTEQVDSPPKSFTVSRENGAAMILTEGHMTDGRYVGASFRETAAGEELPPPIPPHVCALCGEPAIETVSAGGKKFLLCREHLIAGIDDELRPHLEWALLGGHRLPAPPKIDVTSLAEADIDAIERRLEAHSKRCPACGGVKLTSGLTTHRCLECGHSFADADALPPSADRPSLKPK